MQFSLKYAPNFQASLDRLSKSQRFKKNSSDKQALQEKVKEILKEIVKDPFFLNSSVSSEPEPLPKKLKLPSSLEFRKIRFKIGKGESGQVRIMYLVNRDECKVHLLFIFNHDQYEKRPPDDYLKAIIQDALEEQ
ncbi:MAG: hypothetical protein F6K31_15715 [Symploca sp. SIO2G7]|nr:hypothetical protein [Symploca sp. SIO2G7]